ncbi:MAG: methyltransferase domain-containing protein [Proteobacteria bacterium]|nr:methyltransferase domain-containing protein [Pseudomonadota bacterium]
MFAGGSNLRLPLDPVTLSYVMALRGIRPRLSPEPFTYGELGCGTAERLILFAACNPEGTFFGFDPDITALSKAAETAEKLNLKNITFSQASASDLNDAVAKGVIGQKCFDYLIYSAPGNPAVEEVGTLKDCSKVLLRDNGIFAYRYRLYDAANGDQLLFENLTRQILAEQPNAGEALTKEWRQLCQLYFAAHFAQAEAFDKALSEGQGLTWLKNHAPAATQPCRTLEVARTFSGRDFTFLGSAQISGNYMELSTPESAHLPLGARRMHPLYEAFKDLAMQVDERTDLWAHEPLQRSDNLITLFGGFTFGTTEAPERIARTVTFQGKSFSFVGPLYDGVLSLATVMPVTMGDLVHHESLKDIDSLTLLNTVQLAVACGLLQPMRSSFEGGVDMESPKLLGSYNQSLREAQLDLQDYAFASAVVGRPVFLSGMNALVLQALDKGGMTQVGLLLGDQLVRLSQHPYLRPLNLGEPKRAVNEAVRQIETVFHQSYMRWFSLGIVTTENT